MRTLIVGCGYVGIPLGVELKRLGHDVFGVRRSPGGEAELRAAGLEPLVADLAVPASLNALPGPFDWVINCVSSGRGGIDEYRAVFLEGTRNLIDWLAPHTPRKIVYTSSTSVYGQTDASAVKESSPTEPATETGRVLVETEKLWLQAAAERRLPAVILRVAGIYGPERGHLFRQYLKNEARLVGRGDRIINMIHPDDVIAAIIPGLQSGRPGEAYNAVDDEPVAEIHFFRWLSETLGKSMPPTVSPEEVTARKRGLTNKKVQNRRLKMELGCVLRYPTFRQGYTAEIKRLEDSGRLDIAPEPR